MVPSSRRQWRMRAGSGHAASVVVRWALPTPGTPFGGRVACKWDGEWGRTWGHTARVGTRGARSSRSILRIPGHRVRDKTVGHQDNVHGTGGKPLSRNRDRLGHPRLPKPCPPFGMYGERAWRLNVQSGQREPFARSDHISCSHRQGERCHWGKLSTGNGAEPEPSGLAFCQWKGPRLSLRRCACVTCKVSDQIADCMIPLSADMRRMGDLRGGNEINSCQRGSLKFPLIRGATME